jgi:tetraacyldisaccharide 4'-kinase
MDVRRFHDLISGRTRGVGASLARAGLSVLSCGYGAAVRARNASFDLGLRPARHPGGPVVSIGNLTTGGTGKTPVVAWLAREGVAHGRRVAILSRGYGGTDAARGNDEKQVLDRLIPGVPHLQDPDRVAAARRAVAEHGADLLVLDDGFQHRRLARDLDLVLVDALDPWGGGRLLPRGLLREPVSSLRRADAVIVTRADQAAPGTLASIAEVVRRATRGRLADVAQVAFPPQGWIDVAGNRTALAEVSGQRVGAFCGIGHPDAFRRSLAAVGIESDWFEAYPDHHAFGPQDVERLARRVRESGVTTLVCTLKDLVKWTPEDAERAGVPLLALEIGLAWRAGEASVVELFERTLSPPPHAS